MGRTSHDSWSRADTVRVVTMGDGEPAERPCEVEVVSRRLRSRSATARSRCWEPGRPARQTSSTRRRRIAAAAAAATAARRPLVAKLVSDPAYERARRYGLFEGTLEEFQEAASAPVRRAEGGSDARPADATTIVVPSAYLAEIAAWVGSRGRTDPRAHEPGAAAHRSRARALSSRARSSSSAGSPTEGPRHRDRGGRPRPWREARHRRRRA